MNITMTANNMNTMMACRYCPMCRQACSSEFLSYKESDTPRGRALLLFNIYNGGKEYENGTVESIYNCFLCGCCRSWCEGYDEGGYDIPELIKFARRDIVKQGLEPVKVKEMKKSLISNNNIYNIGKDKSFSASVNKKKAEVLYYLGSDVNFNNHEIAEAAISVFKKLGINYTILSDEPDSGKILSLLGYQKEAENKAGELFERIKMVDCRILVTSDPLAYDAFKNDYPKYGYKFEPAIVVKHTAEYFYDLAVEKKLKFNKLIKKITLADSEYLGRFNGIFEAPRLLIESIPGLKFLEMQWNREKMLATGESAFYFNIESIDAGEMLGEKINRMAKDINADMIVTLSAASKNNLNKSSNNIIETMDISEFINGVL